MTNDLVVSLAFETYSDTIERGSFPPDLVVESAISAGEIDRVLVVDPWRSYLHQVNRALRRSVVPFPATSTRAHLAPHRLRRSDPVDYRDALAASRRYLEQVKRAARKLGIERPALLATHPFDAAAAEPADWHAVTYYGWDDWTALPQLSMYWPALESAYADIARHKYRVAGVSERIVERVDSAGPRLVVPNGLRANEWAQPAPAVDWYAESPRPKLLYTGTLDQRVDTTIVRQVAQAFPEASVLLVGTILWPEIEQEFSDLDNVTVRTWLPREVIRGLIFNCDAALIPHVDNDLTRAMSPLKLYEYLAAGRPVVATDLPPIHNVPGVILARDTADFVAGVAVALEQAPTTEADRLAFVQANSWPERMSALLGFALAD